MDFKPLPSPDEVTMGQVHWNLLKDLNHVTAGILGCVSLMH